MMRRLLTTLLATLAAAVLGVLAAVPFAVMFAPTATAAALLGAACAVGAAAGPWLFADGRRGAATVVLAVIAAAGWSALQDPPETVVARAAAPVRLLVDGAMDLLTVPLPVPAEPVFLALPVAGTFLAVGLAARGLSQRRFGLLASPLLALWSAGLILGPGPAAPLAVVAPLLVGLGAAAVQVRSGGPGPRAWGRALTGAAVLTAGAVAAVPLASAAVAAAGASDPVDPRAHVTPPVEPVAIVNPLDVLIGQVGAGGEQPVFTADSDVEPATPFWTVATLDEFDGRSWQPAGTLAPAAGRIAGALDEPYVEARQSITVGAGLAPWVPHLGSVHRLDSRGLLHGRESDLLVDPAAPQGTVRSYDLVGAWPTADLAALRAAGVAQVPEGSPLLETACLPVGVAAAVTQAAAGAANPFDRTAAVVHWMRQSSGLQADREALSGHSCSALTASLDRAATNGPVAASVDQLATVQTLALRSQGIPARLAVGYTVAAPGEDGTYAALASHATAYSQIHLDGIGWIDIAAEPLGAGGTQSTATAVSAAGMLEAVVAAPPAASGQVPQPEPEPAPDRGTASNQAPGSSPVLMLAIATVGLLALAPLFVLVANRVRVHARRHRRGSGDARAQVLGAWAEVRDALATSGIDTKGRTAVQTAHELPLESAARAAVEPLAHLVQRATYDPRKVPPDAARQAWSLAGVARRAIARSQGRRQRIVRFIVPVRAG